MTSKNGPGSDERERGERGKREEREGERREEEREESKGERKERERGEREIWARRFREKRVESEGEAIINTRPCGYRVGRAGTIDANVIRTDIKSSQIE